MERPSRRICTGFLLALSAALTAAGTDTAATPQESQTFTAGRLAMTLQALDGGVRIQHLQDLHENREMLASESEMSKLVETDSTIS